MTSRSLFAGAALALLLSAPASAQFAGTWETNLGLMRLEQDGNRVHGDYDHNAGQLDADVDQHDLTGMWVQNDSEHRCRDKHMDSHYWGHFKLHLDDNGKVFHGYRSLCDGEPASGGEWRGWRSDRGH